MAARLERFILATREFFRKGRADPKHFEEGNTEAFLKNFAKPPSLPASSLSLPNVEGIFGLKKDKRHDYIWRLSSDQIIPVPDTLDRSLEELATNLGQDPTNEASCRLRLNLIVNNCITAERQMLGLNNRGARDQKPVSFTVENHLSLEVKFKRKQYLLQGKSDYAIWYDASDEISTNLVILEAKTTGEAGAGIAQCLCYMAMVHSIRKSEKRKNTIVFGCCSDGFRFTFLRIDNESRYSEWNCQVWGSKNRSSQNEIYTHLRLIIRSAARSSPRSSPERVARIADDTEHGRPYYEFRIGSSADDEPMDID